MLEFLAYGCEPPRAHGSHRHGYDGRILRVIVAASGNVLGQIGRFGHLWERVWLPGRERNQRLLLALLFTAFLSVLIVFPLAVSTFIFVGSTLGHLSSWSELSNLAAGVHPEGHEWTFPDRPRFWSLFVLGIVLGFYLVFALIKDRICTIDVYFLRANEPLPLIALDRSARYVLAVRLLEPNVAKRVRSYAYTKKLTDFADRPARGRLMDRVQLYKPNPHEGRMSDDVWTLVRFAVSRTLFGPASEVLAARSFRFAFKIHLPQIKAFLLLLVMALVLPLSGLLGPEESGPQYSLLLGGLGFLWAYWAIHLHREQQRALVEWSQEWAKKPFSGCPIFFFDPDNSPEYRWEELTEDHFEVPIQSYGLGVQDLLQIALGLFLVAYLTLLQLIK